MYNKWKNHPAFKSIIEELVHDQCHSMNILFNEWIERTIDNLIDMDNELTALKVKMANGIPVDIAYTGSTNIITNLPNALYGEFILLGLNEMEDDDG